MAKKVLNIQNTKNPPNKKSNVLKVLKSRYFIFILLTVFVLLSALFLFMLDSSNTFRAKYFPAFDKMCRESPFLRQFFSALGVKYVDGVAITTWLFFFVGFGGLYTGFIIWAFFAPIKKKVVYDKKYDQYVLKKKNTIYNVIFFGIILIAVAGTIFLIYKIFPWSRVSWKDISLERFINFLHCLGILLLLFSIPIVAILIIILVFKVLVWVFVFFASSVSKGVMKTQGYQEALATSQIVNSRLQKETLKELDKNAPVVVTEDESKHVGEMVNSGDFGKYESNPKYISFDTLNKYQAFDPKPEYVFPALIAIDAKYKNKRTTIAKSKKTVKKIIKPKKGKQEKLTLKNDPNNKLINFAPRFQAFLANRNNLYYSLEIIRTFVAGLNASRIILLEGLSGTGKTTLPRMFTEFIGGTSTFFPVQSTWRDRSDIIGYYSDFSKQFKETEFLKTLYEGTYNPKEFNMMVLDEMNISRVEYYFADFLSILEYPQSDWLVPLINTATSEKLPKKLENGKIRVPLNTWFVGTINVDDSTFTVSDKVYDRVIVLDFEELSMPFKSEVNDEPWPMSPQELFKTFDYACKTEMYQLTQNERTKFIKLCDYASEIFDIKFGNRILNQVYNFVPAYLALGGSKEEALDFMFAKKILRKIDGKYENYISVGLVKLSKYLQSAYGKGHFKLTEAYINKVRKKLA